MAGNPALALVALGLLFLLLGGFVFVVARGARRPGTVGRSTRGATTERKKRMPGGSAAVARRACEPEGLGGGGAAKG